jgi:hypothetical protein
MRRGLTGLLLGAVLAGLLGCGGKSTEPVKIEGRHFERLQKADKAAAIPKKGP